MKKNTRKIIEYIVLLILFITIGALSLVQSVKMRVIEKINYEELGNITYKVYLTDQKFYNSEYLNENMQYISSIIDYFDLYFNYVVKFDDKIDYNLKTKLMANVKIVDRDDSSNIIYSSTETLQDIDLKSFQDKDYISVSKNYKLDYNKYNRLTNEFKSNYGISADCKLLVEFYIDYEGNYKNINNINNNRIMQIEIPLSEQMINVYKSNKINNNASYEIHTNKSIYNTLLLIVGIFFLIISLFTLIRIVVLCGIINKLQTKYEKEIKKILRQYDSYITESSDIINLKDKSIIQINSFKELLDVRNNIEKTIIYNRIDDSLSRFVIIDDNEVYCFEMNEKDY